MQFLVPLCSGCRLRLPKADARVVPGCCPRQLSPIVEDKLRSNSMCKPQITCEAWRVVRKEEEIK